MKIPRRRSCPRISKARRRETRPQIEPLELRTVLASLYLIGTGVSVVAEGQAFTSTDLMDFGDRVTTSKPSDFTVVIDWGDGTPKDFGTVIRGSAGGYEAHGGHTYQQEGSYDVEVGVGRNSNGSDFVLGNPGVVVNNGALAAATPVVVKATQGKVSANVLVAGFADSGLPDPVGRVPSSTIQGVFQAALTGKALPSLDQVFPGLLGQYTATIDWGDGTAPTPGTVQLAGSNFSVSGTHAYARPGSFAINATVADRGVDQVYLPTQGHFLASADFNGDGRPDLAYSLVKRLNSGDELDLITLINQPDGSYLPASGSPARLTYPYFPFSGGEDWIEARAADLDLDGRQDLVVTDRSDVAGNTTFASYNQGGGNFDYNHTNIVNVFTGTVADVAIARVDGDAYPDIVLATKDQASFTPKGSLLTYRNLGTSHGFSSLGSAINVAYYPDQVRVADFNGDGRADLAVSGTKNVGGTFVGVFETRLGLSSSGFGSPSSVIPAIGGNTIISAMADLNGDGLKDFAVYGDNGKISLILGTGPGTFARATGSPVDFSSFTSQLSSTTSVNNLDLASIGQALDVALPAIRAVLDPTGQTHQTDLDAALLLQELNFTSYFNFKIDGVGDFNQDGLVDFIGHPTRYNFVDPANSSASFFTPLTNYLIRGTAAKTTLRATARVAPRATDDFDGDGRSDLTVYLPAAGAFGIRPSNGGPDRIVPFGTPGAGKSIPVPGDVDGDGKDDLTVYLPDLGAFATRPSTGGPDRIVPFGPAGLGQSIPRAGRLFRHGPGEPGGLSARGRLVRDPDPRRPLRRGHPVRLDGGGPLDPRAGRL